MIFFKPRQRAGNILPPPLPLDDEEDKPKFFDEIVGVGKKGETSPEIREFSALIKEFDKGMANKKTAKKSKVSNKSASKKKIHDAKDAALEFFGQPELDLGLPENRNLGEQEIELPDRLEDINLDKIEVKEAQEEIRTAIEKIKKQEKSSFFKRLFGTKKTEAQEEEFTQKTSGIAAVQENVMKARRALTSLNLEVAKRNYIEAMRIYNALDEEQKGQVYQDIKELYIKRKNAETAKKLNKQN